MKIKDVKTICGLECPLFDPGICEGDDVGICNQFDPEMELDEAVKVVDTALRVQVDYLTQKLAESKTAAVQWVTYDGTPETLPKSVMDCYRANDMDSLVNERVLLITADHNKPELAVRDSDGRWYYSVSLYRRRPKKGDRWAYLPTPPEASE